jgi:hypothetical protein
MSVERRLSELERRLDDLLAERTSFLPFIFDDGRGTVLKITHGDRFARIALTGWEEPVAVANAFGRQLVEVLHAYGEFCSKRGGTA